MGAIALSVKDVIKEQQQNLWFLISTIIRALPVLHWGRHFIYFGTPDLPLRFLILLGASIGAVFIDIGLITLIMVFLSL